VDDVDRALRETVAAIEGRVREPVGRSVHIHQLDGEARTEAMVHLDPAGVRVDWVHGHGDCAITGEGAAILDVLRGTGDPDALEREVRLVLYGDRELIRALPSIFA
jgi:predicted lipid carrier protein YhbT